MEKSRTEIIKKGLELEKRVKTYLKNSEAIADFLTFYSYMLSDSYDLGTTTIFDKLVQDLEDDEVDFPLRAENYYEVAKDNNAIRRSLCDELKKYNFVHLLEKTTSDYRLENVFLYYRRKELSDKEINFIPAICDYSCDYAGRLLVSDINMNKKMQMLWEMLVYLINHQYPDKLEYILDEPKKYLKKESADEKLNELFVLFNQAMNVEARVKLFNIINIHRRASDWIVLLEQKGIVEFMDLHGHIKIGGKGCDVSPCACLNLKEVCYFKNLYESKEYMSVPEYLRKNDDLAILEQLDPNEFSKLISLRHFVLTEEKVKIIATRFMDYVKEIEDQCCERLKQSIIYAITSKSKTSKEYRKNYLLSVMFNKLTDYKKMKLELLQEEQELEQKRSDLILRLKNMSESLTEQVPGPRRIKDLHFAVAKQ